MGFASLKGEQALATATNEADEIRRRMAQIRHDLHQDVKQVVEGAGGVTDWRRYVRAYPWPLAGAAVAVGYLVVPKRRRNVPRDVARRSDLAELRAVAAPTGEPETEDKKRAKSLLGSVFGMVAPLAWRLAQNYAMSYLEQWLAQQQQQAMASSGPPIGASTPPGQPGGSRGTRRT